MKRKMGKLTALFTAAAMTVSVFAGAMPVYADELSDDNVALEVISEDGSYDAKEDQQELTEDVADPAEEQILKSQDKEVLDPKDLSDIKADELLSIDEDKMDGNNKDTKDTEKAEKDDIVSADGEINVPETNGAPIHFYKDGLIQKNQHIYFGTLDESEYAYRDSEGNPYPCWRVLDPEKDNAGDEGAIFLISDSLWGNKDNEEDGGIPFSYNANRDLNNEGTIALKNNTNSWYYIDENTGKNWVSYAWLWCYNFLLNTFTDEEQDVIRPVYKTDDGYDDPTHDYDSYPECTLYDDQVFFLSLQELNDYIGNLYDGDGSTNLYEKLNWKPYWLRTASNRIWGEDKYANYMNIYYTNSDIPVTEGLAARPAFNIDSSKILLLSDIYEAKESDGVGEDALVHVGYWTNTRGIKNWRLTLADSSRDSFKASWTNNTNNTYVVPGEAMKIQYSGAKTGSNEFVSVMICDSTGKDILWYGRVVNDSASGTATVNLPEDVTEGETYKVMVYSEQYNGDLDDTEHPAGSLFTDLASDPRNCTFTIKVPYHMKRASLSPSSFNYDEKSHIPSLTHNGKTLKLNTHYKIKSLKDPNGKSTSAPLYGGTYTFEGEGIVKNGYYGSAIGKFKIIPRNVSGTASSASSYKYDGKSHIPYLTWRGKKLVVNKDYRYSLNGTPVNAGTYKMTITGINGYTGTVVRYITITKLPNTLNVTRKTKTFNVSANKKTKRVAKNKTLKKANVYKFKKKGVGKITYSLASVKKGSEYFSSFFKVNNSNGNVTVRAGARKGTYTVKVNVTAAGATNYMSKTQTVTFNIKIK